MHSKERKRKRNKHTNITTLKNVFLYKLMTTYISQFIVNTNRNSISSPTYLRNSFVKIRKEKTRDLLYVQNRASLNLEGKYVVNAFALFQEQ